MESLLEHAMESLPEQALAWLSGPFRPQWPLSEQAMESLRWQARPLYYVGQALAWLSGPFRPRWPLPEHALELLPEHAMELLPEQAMELLPKQALQSLRGPGCS
jgi:hypothetical protein